MATESVVIIPPSGDFDYIGFSFNGVFSYNEDFVIYRTSDGDRYNLNANPNRQEKILDNPSRDGVYYLGATNK